MPKEGDGYYGYRPGGGRQFYVYTNGKWHFLNPDGTVGAQAPGQTQTNTPSSQPQKPKSPDPVISGKGTDYAGMAQPIRGMISAHTNLGVGCALRSYGIAESLNEMRNMVKEAAKRAVRRRPHQNTRSWQKTAQDLKRKFDTVANEFAEDYQRARRAAHITGRHIRFIEDLAQGGHGHLVHMEL